MKHLIIALALVASARAAEPQLLRLASNKMCVTREGENRFAGMAACDPTSASQHFETRETAGQIEIISRGYDNEAKPTMACLSMTLNCEAQFTFCPNVDGEFHRRTLWDIEPISESGNGALLVHKGGKTQCLQLEASKRLRRNMPFMFKGKVCNASRPDQTFLLEDLPTESPTPAPSEMPVQVQVEPPEPVAPPATCSPLQENMVVEYLMTEQGSYTPPLGFVHDISGPEDCCAKCIEHASCAQYDVILERTTTCVLWADGEAHMITGIEGNRLYYHGKVART
jgi:hypothetical protein